MSCNSKYIELMHDYLDEDISTEAEKELRDHLYICSECQQHFHELKKAIALVQSTSHIQAPPDFTAKVMARLPEEKKVVRVKRWMRFHPLVTAAAVFMVLMMGSVFSIWSEDQKLAVSKQANIRIEDNTVIVPEGKVIEGDLVVRNGDIKIEGEVRGNVTVINGNQYLASAGNVTGEIKEIDQMFEWIWFHMKEAVKDTISFISGSPEEKPST
ncbi:zf-HC2 domain-containing protein [Bacillus salitolerans]|uniref:Zf-HC2 domain-containing protein n=1 Tax=Bacillus salitolerans TaxID=1437434 RepID=A0ABW4LR74_9BACI